MTLIEILLVIVIVGIIASIAYPSFTDHVLKAHRTTAKADMLRLQLKLEQSYDNGYSWSSLISGGTCTSCESDNERYSFAIASSASKTYIITATALPTRGQSKDGCLPAGDTNKKLTLDSTNAVTPSDCWK